MLIETMAAMLKIIEKARKYTSSPANPHLRRETIPLVFSASWRLEALGAPALNSVSPAASKL